MNKTFQKQLWEFFRDVTSWGGFAVYLLVTLLYIKSPLFINLLFGFFFTAVIVIAIRLFYFKNRPKQEEHANFIEKIAASAFPSLHTARTVFLALLLSRYYNQIYLTAAFALVAALVAYSRIYLQKHDWSDVAGGIVIAVAGFIISSLLL